MLKENTHYLIISRINMQQFYMVHINLFCYITIIKTLEKRKNQFMYHYPYIDYSGRPPYKIESGYQAVMRRAKDINQIDRYCKTINDFNNLIINDKIIPIPELYIKLFFGGVYTLKTHVQ